MKKNWYRILFRRRFTVALLLLMQFAVLLFLLEDSRRKYFWLGPALTIMSTLVTLRIISSRDKSAYKLTWSLMILVFPVFGGLFYLLYKLQTRTAGLHTRAAHIEKASRALFLRPGDACAAANRAFPTLARQTDYLQDYVGFPIYEHTATSYYGSGEEKYAALLEALRSAKRYIFLEYFIIRDGKMWDTILEILIEKAAKGVEVRVIYDDMGCFLLLPIKYPKLLEQKGIKCAVFNRFRPFLSALQNNRDHRKIAVIDGEIAFTGGVNLADEYINRVHRFGHWRDAAISMRGDAAWSMTVLFLEMWSLCKNKAEDFNLYYPSTPTALITSDGFVQPYADSPLDGEHVGEHVYLETISSAQKYVYICTPYLIIDDDMVSALILAAKSGVDVRIITPHIGDKRLVHMTTRSYYRELTRGGVKIYEYLDGFTHAKTFVADDTVAIVGTTNLDFRSLYLHFECGVRLLGTSSVHAVRQDFERTLMHCREITAADCKYHPFVRTLQDILRLFAPLM